MHRTLNDDPDLGVWGWLLAPLTLLVVGAIGLAGGGIAFVAIEGVHWLVERS